MQVKGKAILEFVDVNTGKKRVEERDNFIFLDKYIDLFQGYTTLERLAIFFRGSTTYPIFNRYNTYYGYYNYNYIYTGYAPSGKELKKYFPKTSTSPAYWEFYSLFLPPSTTSAISCIGLMSYDVGDNRTEYSYYSSYDYVKTAINLYPPCYQSPTEYLNVYYRLILVEDETDTTNNDWVKEQFLLDINRSSKLFYNNDNIQLYPFRIEQDLGANGFVNFLSDTKYKLPSKQTVHPNGLNLSLYSARKIYNYPDDPPNQYNQIQDAFLNTILRAGRTRYDYILSFLHPDKFTLDIGGPEGFTGIGNVFGTSANSTSSYFDPANFPLGSGRMFASGQWNDNNGKQPFPSKFEVKITQTGELATDMKYQVREVHRTPNVVLILLPFLYKSSPNFSNPQLDFENAKNRMYSNPNHVHVSYYAGVRKYIEDRSFITYDSTGITIYDIYYGKLQSWDATTTPSLGVTNVQDVKVDTDKNIWVACANTGLWKVTITETETTITHITAPPGCQSKVYALDVDNFGNVYAIFWGLGLHYSTDGGQSWVNAIINYPSFSDFDEGGTNSKWRFCSRLIVNPHRDVGNGDAQILLLQRTDVNDGSVTAGCWYDQISANVTGITDYTLRSQLTFVRNSNRHHSVAVAQFANKWYFVTNISSVYSVISYTSQHPDFFGQTLYCINHDVIMQMPFQHNAASTRVKLRTFSDRSADFEIHNNLEYSYDWCDTTGSYREYILCSSINSVTPHVIDVAVDESVIYPRSNSSSYYNENRYATNCCFIGKNRIVGFEYYSYSSDYYMYWIVNEAFGNITDYRRHYNSTLWGWDGGNWVKNHPGSKTGHLTAEPFIKGISLRFENGPTSTTSFVATDKYTFTCFDGYYKDNSSKIWIKDTIYYKPKTVETTFTPSTVQLYDRSNQVGILNSLDINQDWNIDKLPDTTYDGQPLVLNGDPLYPYVEYLNYFEEAGNYGMKDEKYNQPPTAIEGTLSPSTDQPIFWSGLGQSKPTTYFNGESGIFYSSQTRYSMGSGNFTLEMWIYPEVFNVTEQILVDFRNDWNEIGALFLDKSGKLAWRNGSVSYGNTGPSVVFDSWNFITLVRKANNQWEMTLNGVSVANWTDSTGFPSTRPLHIGKSFSLTTNWIKENCIVPNTKFMNPSGVLSAEAIIPNTSSTSYHRVWRSINLPTAGPYTSSIFAKKGTRRYFMLQTKTNNYDRRSVYDFDTDSFVTIDSEHIVGRELLSDGWVRLWVTTTENSNNVSRNFSWGPAGSTYPFSSWSGNGTEESCYIWGAMLNAGNTVEPYVPSGTSGNMWLEDSENFGGNWRGFHGYISNLRITRNINRYDGNISQLPDKPFQNTGNNYSGARLKFQGNYLQGGIIAKKELVGNWTVIFRDITPWFRTPDAGRPSLVFGITSAPVINNLTDIGYRFLAGSDSNLLFQRWMDVWGAGNLGTTVNAVRFRKINQTIFVDTSEYNGSIWTNRFSYTDYAGIHYIAMWQERPSADNATRPLISPSVEIVQNGSDYISRVGSDVLATGAFHPKFLAVDSYWESDFKIQLDGVPTTKNRSNYQAEALPLQGEVYMHQHGTLRFHPDDVGKTITGTVMALHD